MKLHQLAIQISAETQKLFPAPMKLEYEGKIYKDFFILSKKRYTARACDEYGVMSSKIMKKGVQTQRRDSTKLLKSIYDKAIEHIMNGMKYEDMMNYLTDKIQDMFTFQYPDKYYVYKAGQCDKIEEDVYFRTYRNMFQLDYLYYVEHQLMNPLEEIVEKAYRKDKHYVSQSIKKLYQTRVQYYLVVQRLKELFDVKLEFDGEEPVNKRLVKRKVIIE